MNAGAAARTERVVYDDGIVRHFTLASVIWGVVALLLGVFVACQLVWHQLNLAPWLAFGRLRPLHTNAAIFAFVGNMMFAGIYYSMQRLLKTRMASDLLSKLNFWGWQLIILCAAITLPLGLSQSKEYAELIWPVDILVALVWVIFAVNFFWTLSIRNERNLYVAIWFYIATVVTIPVLYIVNNLQIPTGMLHSYGVFAGVQDALTQWWYGHNAVGFFLTTPILGIMYYFVPKAAGRPVYSYRLSVVHFWALVFLYIWAGPHHLLNTALPDWAQSLGMVFSVMLWAPSWGGMVNGLLTLRGSWDKLRGDPILKLFAAGITFYGMSTFEGPLLSIKSVSALAHYTDWIVGHVHSGALGWNGFMAAAMFYWLVPRLYGTKLYSTRLADAHVWLGTFGILLYVVAMWTSGLNQGFYWRALDQDGFLKYPDFIESLGKTRILWGMRAVGGLMYLAGYVLMVWNLFATIRQGHAVNAETEVAILPKEASTPVWALIKGTPVVLSFWILVVGTLLFLSTPLTNGVLLMLAAFLTVTCVLIGAMERREKGSWHRLLEGRPLAFTLLVLVAILIGGIAELVPTIAIRRDVPLTPVAQAQVQASVAGAAAPAVPALDPNLIQKPYSPLELEGRDTYVREGCYNCHSQMIRPFRHETLRYGAYSRLEEFIYDRPFQWGSKRTGPDLHRVGGKYPNLWHYQHFMDPRSLSPGSNMPPFKFLKAERLDLRKTTKKMQVLQQLGVPYTDAEIASAAETARSQGALIVADLATQGVTVEPESRLVALISYVQRVGRGPQPTGK